MNRMITYLAVVCLLCLSATTSNSSTQTKFIVTGDSRGDGAGVNTIILSEIVEAVLTEEVDFVLFSGDLVNGYTSDENLLGELLEWRSIMEPLYNAGIGVYPCRGNHDAGNKDIWDSVFSGIYSLPQNGPDGEKNITFSFDFNNVFVAGLDQYINLNRVNQEWLETQFELNMRPHVFIFGHTPAFKVRHSDCLDDYPDKRNLFWQSLINERAKIYFCGHDHFYDHMVLTDLESATNNEIHQMIVGTAGAPLRSDGVYNGINDPWTPLRLAHKQIYGYVLVEVDWMNVKITWKQRNQNGTYSAGDDSWEYTLSPDPCCTGIRGNIDSDTRDAINIIDLTVLIEYLFHGTEAPNCELEADINGDFNINIVDLTLLLDYIFNNGPAPMNCNYGI